MLINRLLRNWVPSFMRISVPNYSTTYYGYYCNLFTKKKRYNYGY